MKARPVVVATFASLLFLAHVLFAHRANAQDGVTVETDPAPPKTSSAPAETTAPAPAPYERTTRGTNGEIESGDGPRARVGFQMAMRTGYAIPMGSATSGTKMSDQFGGQVPFIVDIGGKVHPYIFVGGYFGLGVGGCGNLVAEDCASISLKMGAEIIVNILPRNLVNPWVGYGIGFEISGPSANSGSDIVQYFGPEFGHFMGGVDFRVTRGFGIGPFVDFGVGEYTGISVTQNNVDVAASLDNIKALHEWLTLGAKFTIFP